MVAALALALALALAQQGGEKAAAAAAAARGLVVPARRGQALVWQNHRAAGSRDGGPWGSPAAADSGKMSLSEFEDLDWSTLHAGCDVGEGAEKWVANQWVWQENVERLCGIVAAGREAPAAVVEQDGDARDGGDEDEGDEGEDEREQPGDERDADERDDDADDSRSEL